MTFSSAFVQAAHIPLWRLMNGKGVILDAPAVCAELQGWFMEKTHGNPNRSGWWCKNHLQKYKVNGWWIIPYMPYMKWKIIHSCLKPPTRYLTMGIQNPMDWWPSKSVIRLLTMALLEFTTFFGPIDSQRVGMLRPAGRRKWQTCDLRPWTIRARTTPSH